MEIRERQVEMRRLMEGTWGVPGAGAPMPNRDAIYDDIKAMLVCRQ